MSGVGGGGGGDGDGTFDESRFQESTEMMDANYSRELFESVEGVSLDDSTSYRVHTPSRHERNAMQQSVDADTARPASARAEQLVDEILGDALKT